MKKNKISLISLVLFLSFALFYVGCSPDQPTEALPIVNSGNADFSRFAVIGASYEAGVIDGYLIGENELHSYPTMIARQMNLTVDSEDADFVTPYFGDPGAGTKFELTGFDGASPILEITPVSGIPVNIDYPLPYNNLAVPGALAGEVLFTTTSENSLTGNPLFDAILRNDPTSDPETHRTAVEQAIALDPTFMIVGLLGNDVLGAALSGHTIPGMPVPPDQFEQAYAGIIQSLTTALPDLKLAGVNIPDVTVIPHFTTVPKSVDVPSVGPVDLFVQMHDGSVQQADDNALILLAASSIIGDVSGTYGPEGVPIGFDPTAPLPSSLVLDGGEVLEMQAAVQAYNESIEAIANQYGFPVVDSNALADQLGDDGVEIWNDIVLTSDYISGGAFSLDGIHLTKLGSVILANQFIEEINTFYGSDIQPVSPYQYF